MRIRKIPKTVPINTFHQRFAIVLEKPGINLDEIRSFEQSHSESFRRELIGKAVYSSGDKGATKEELSECLSSYFKGRYNCSDDELFNSRLERILGDPIFQRFVEKRDGKYFPNLPEVGKSLSKHRKQGGTRLWEVEQKFLILYEIYKSAISTYNMKNN
jgi:hypothetical protein